MTPNEVLKLVEKRDGSDLNKYLRELGSKNREEFLEEKYADQDFSGWIAYREWLMEALNDNPLH